LIINKTRSIKMETVILNKKAGYKPASKDFEELVDWGTKFAKEKGIKPEDVLEVLEKS